MKDVCRVNPTLVALLAATALIAASASAQLNQPLHRDGWILAAVHAPGQQGSIWRTDLWIVAKEYFGTVDLYFCQTGMDNSDVQPLSVSFSGERVQYFEDAVDHFLDLDGGSWLGALRYSATLDIQIWARVYSISPDGTKSYGQLIEGIPAAHASPDAIPWDSRPHQHMYAVKHTANGRFRVNVGIVNPSAVDANYDVDLVGPDGNSIASAYASVPPFSMVQLGDPFATANGGEWSAHWIRVICSTDGGGALAYASVVDNATNDAFFVRGVKDYNQQQPGLNCTRHTDGWILAAARAPGQQGSIWRTDLWVRTASYSNPKVTLYFCETGKNNGSVQGIDLPTTEGAATFYVEDVVEQFLHVGSRSWVGAIHYVADTEVQVWARVYSISPDGTASYGQVIEGIPTADSSPPSGSVSSTAEYQWLFAAKHTADDRFRVNVGVINPTGVTCHYWVAMYDAVGGSGPFVELDVPAYSMTQLGDPFAEVDDGEWNEKVIRVQPGTPGGGGFAYLSVVDNATNDAFFVRGIKLLAYPTP